MAVDKYSRRRLIKRSNTPGVVPTEPGVGAVDPNDHTLGGWLDTDLYVGEMFANTADDKVWIRTDNGIVELDTNTSTFSFLNLTDTPVGYGGSAGYAVVVNATEDGLEFVDYATPQNLVDQLDTPAVYSDGKVLVSTTTDFQYQDYISEFINLTDTPIDYLGHNGELLQVNVSEDGVEFVDGSTLYVDLLTAQSIAGIKTFDDIVINGTLTTPEITLNGVNINTILTDVALIGASDTNLATTLAIKTYVDNQVITAVGGDYVARTGAVTIEDVKTFTDDTQFNSDITVDGDINVSTDINLTNNLNIDLGSIVNIGDPAVVGSYRLIINGNGDLEVTTLTASGWEYRDNFINRKTLRIADTWNDATEPLIDKIEDDGTTLIPNSTSLATTKAIDEMIALASGTGKWEAGIGTFGIQTIGTNCDASGDYSIAGGRDATASGSYSNTEGYGTVASGDFGSHAEGTLTTASGDFGSHAEGSTTLASGNNSHAEGYQTIASNVAAHAEGQSSHASGYTSHAQGYFTTAGAQGSHSGGKGYNNTYRVLANGIVAFNHSEVDNTYTGVGANAANSAILGGFNNEITSTATKSVVLGGSNISLTRANTVAAPNLDIRGDITKSFDTFTSDETIDTETLAIIYIDASSNDVTVILPAATTVAGREYKIKCIDDTNIPTVSGGGTDIDGAATYVLTLNETLTLHSDGTEWRIL